MLDTIHLRNGWKLWPFFLFPPSHDQSETQNLSISSVYFAPSYSVHSWSSFLRKLPHKTCVICEGMHTTLRAEVIIFDDIPSSLTSLTRHVMCIKLEQRERQTHYLLHSVFLFFLEPRLKSDCRCILWPRILLHYGVQWKLFMWERQVDQGFC